MLLFSRFGRCDEGGGERFDGQTPVAIITFQHIIIGQSQHFVFCPDTQHFEGFTIPRKFHEVFVGRNDFVLVAAVVNHSVEHQDALCVGRLVVIVATVIVFVNGLWQNSLIVAVATLLEFQPRLAVES